MSVLILGGTGSVGRRVVELLGNSGDLGKSDNEVLVASRNRDSAASVAAPVSNASPVVIDLDRSGPVFPSDVTVVVNCTGTDRIGTAEAAAERGVDLIDISAGSAHLRDLVGLDARFTDAGARCLKGVGLAPGLSTMLAVAVHDPTALEPIDVHCVLDVSDSHGPSAAEFTVGKLGTDFVDPASGDPVRNFTGLRRPRVLRELGYGPVARADFPDQHELTAGLGVPVRTTYGFTSSLVTVAFSLVTHVPGAGAAASWITSRMPRPQGTGVWVVAAESGPRRAWATGVGQSQGTAAMTAIAAQLLTGRGVAPGVHSLYEVASLDDTVSGDALSSDAMSSDALSGDAMSSDALLAKLARHGIAVALAG